MRAQRIMALLLGVNLVLLVAGACWLRTFSLASIPTHWADESYYGIQTARLLRGEPFQIRTTSGNILSPLFVLTQAPILLLSGPTIWALRLPAVLSGLLTVGLVYRLGRRWLDRETALIAAVIVLTLPTSVRFSRVGCEFSQTPLVGAIAFALAMGGRGTWLYGWLWLGLLVHPTNIFLLPLVGPIYLVRVIRRDPGRWRRALATTGLAAASIALPFAAWVSGNSNVQGHAEDPRDWLAFLDSFGRFLAHFSREAPSGTPGTAYRWAFRIALVALGGIGGTLLWRRRRWDRLAVLVGLATALASFHVAAGSTVLDDHEMKRYGAVLIVPSALAVAVLIEACLPRMTPSRGVGRVAGLAVVLAGPWLMLLATKVQVFELDLQRPGESLGRFLSDDPFEEAADVILRNIDRSRGPSPHLIIAQDLHLNGQQIDFLTSHRPDVQVVPWFTLFEVWVKRQEPDGAPLIPRTEKLVEAIRGGAYAVTCPGSPADRGGGLIEAALAAHVPADQLARWNNASMAVYRLREPRPIALRHADQDSLARERAR